MAWTKHLKDPKQRADLESLLRNSSQAFSRLLEIIEEKERTLNNSDHSIKDFEDAAWAFKQAFRNGQRAGMKEIRDLLEFIKG